VSSASACVGPHLLMARWLLIRLSLEVLLSLSGFCDVCLWRLCVCRVRVLCACGRVRSRAVRGCIVRTRWRAVCACAYTRVVRAT
jgi:hypothetical protein